MPKSPHAEGATRRVLHTQCADCTGRNFLECHLRARRHRQRRLALGRTAATVATGRPAAHQPSQLCIQLAEGPLTGAQRCRAGGRNLNRCGQVVRLFDRKLEARLARNSLQPAPQATHATQAGLAFTGRCVRVESVQVEVSRVPAALRPLLDLSRTGRTCGAATAHLMVDAE